MSTATPTSILSALACLTWVWGASLPALSQTPPALSDQYLRMAWTTEEGLPQNTVSAIVQTRDGYLWLGTFGGLARFDGVKFTVFNSSNTPALKSNRIGALYEDREGSLWIGSGYGGLTRYRGGTFTTYSLQESGRVAWISSLAEDGEGGLWVGTFGGLARLQAGRLAYDTAHAGLPRAAVQALSRDGAGNLWLSMEGGKLFRLQGGAVTAYPIPGVSVDAFHLGRDGGLWLSTSRGLARLKDGEFSTWPARDGFPGGLTRSICEDDQGDFWVGGRGGLFQVRRSDLTTYHRKDGPANYNVRSILLDREGNLWVGTDADGVMRWRKSHPVTSAAGLGLPEKSALPIYEDRAGSLWIGFVRDGLYRIQPGKVQPSRVAGLPFDVLWSIGGDREGNLWLGSHEASGLASFQNGRWIRYTTADGLSSNAIYAIYQDAQGTLWIGTGDAGLNRFQDGVFTSYRTSHGLPHDQIAFITEDRHRALWLGTPAGLSRFKDGRFTNYGSEVGLSFVRAIYEDVDGTLWIGTYGYGLSRFKDGKFTRMTESDGLFDNVVSRILEDDHGRFWLSGNRGIFQISRQALNDFADGKLKSLTCSSYGVADGMKTSETNGGGQPAGWKTRDGRLWFPLIKGVAVIDPRALNPLPPPVFIEQVTLDGATLAADQFGRINPGQERLEIHYTGLSLSRPEQVKFKYRLAGLDQDWVEAGGRRTAYYSHLPPGEYDFRVIAANSDGVWNQTGASLRFVVVPPFWRTWWFLTLGLASVAGAALLAYRRRIAQLHRQHAEREAFSRRLIDSQEHERKRIAAELHDSLGQSLVIIKNRARLSLREPDRQAAMLAHLDGISATASQAIEEVREIAFDLRPHLLDRLGLTKTLESMLTKVFNASGLSFEAEIDPIDDLFSKESEILLYRIIQEGVNNVVKHAQATHVRVAIKREARHLVLTIRDNGQGFDPAAAEAGEVTGHCFGLIGMAERARLLGGRWAIESAVGQGTTVTTSLELKDGHHEP